MVAFAANSVFCRLALREPANDPVSFTLLRLFSGAVVLSFFLLKYRKSSPLTWDRKTLLGPLLLFSYALFFSLSYVIIDAGTGALILFASVQLTMMTFALVSGHRLTLKELLGMTLAITGFIWLLLPGATMPAPGAAGLMVLSGVSWGFYSLLGQGSANPIFITSRNFVGTLPLVLLLILTFPYQLTREGAGWAVLSGAVTSGLGYVLWYIVLRELSTSSAAIVQLSVPAIAALGGVLFLAEAIDMRLVVASILIFSGIILKVKAADVS